jgi:hypothetical protein
MESSCLPVPNRLCRRMLGDTMNCVKLPKTSNGLAVAQDLIDTAKLTAGVQAQAMLAAGVQAMLAKTADAQAQALVGEAVARLESERIIQVAAISVAHRNASSGHQAYMAQLWTHCQRMLPGYWAQVEIAVRQAASLRAAAAPDLPLLRVALRRCAARTSTAPPDEDNDPLASLACVAPRPASSRFIPLSIAVRPTLAPVVWSAASP